MGFYQRLRAGSQEMEQAIAPMAMWEIVHIPRIVV
jgi:hypothetical protein